MDHSGSGCRGVLDCADGDRDVPRVEKGVWWGGSVWFVLWWMGEGVGTQSNLIKNRLSLLAHSQSLNSGLLPLSLAGLSRPLVLPALKLRFVSAPILTYANFSRPFILEVDSSHSGLEAVLSQETNKGVMPAEASGSERTERNMGNYSSTPSNGFVASVGPVG